MFKHGKEFSVVGYADPGIVEFCVFQVVLHFESHKIDQFAARDGVSDDVLHSVVNEVFNDTRGIGLTPFFPRYFSSIKISQIKH